MNLRKVLLQKSIDEKSHQAAASPHNLKFLPTEAQRSAGNYSKGHHRIAGMNISIENPAVSVRNLSWTPMSAHYGYIRGTVGNDGDHVDVFVKPGTPDDWEGDLFVIEQNKSNGIFDEHKVMLGWEDKESARRSYLNHYPNGWSKNIRDIYAMRLKEFKEWMWPAKKSLVHGMLEKKSKQRLVNPRKLISEKKKKLSAGIAAYLKRQAKRIAEQAVKGYIPNPVSKVLSVALRKAMTPEEIIARIKLEDWDSLVNEEMTPELVTAFAEAGIYAANSVGLKEPLTELLNERALAFAEKRSAELVTDIEESTREMLRATIANGIESGMSSEDLADAIEESGAFSAERADLIASYELGQAMEEGNMAAWKESGVVVGKQWITADDELVSDDCSMNAAQGVIPLDEEFQSGHMHPMAHPRCRCSCVAVTESGDEVESLSLEEA